MQATTETLTLHKVVVQPFQVLAPVEVHGSRAHPSKQINGAVLLHFLRQVLEDHCFIEEIAEFQHLRFPKVGPRI